MTTTAKLVFTPDTKLVRWEGDYLYKSGLIKVYFFLGPNEVVDEKIQYTIYPLIPIANYEEMLVLGRNILEYTVLFVDESRGTRATTTEGGKLIYVFPVVDS